MADILKEDEEHENVYRHLKVVLGETKEVFEKLLAFYLGTIPETYEEFIEKNAHDIYHFCYPEQCCQCQCQSCNKKCPQCTCRPIRTTIHPNRRRILYPQQLDIFFDSSGTKIPGHDQTYRSARNNCCRPINPDLNIGDLDVTLARFLLVNFTTIVQPGTQERKALDDLVAMRNNFAHAAKTRMSNQDYQKCQQNTKKQLLILAKVYGNEQETKDRLVAINHEPFNPKVCLQLFNTLLMQAKFDQEFQEAVNKLTEIVKELKTLKTDQIIPEFIKKDLEDQIIDEGHDVCFEIWLKETNIQVKWYKNNKEIMTGDKMSLITKGSLHKLRISRCCEDDKGIYTVKVNDTERQAKLDVKEFYTRNLKDIHCIEGSNVTFDCEVLDSSSDMKVQWYKDGVIYHSKGKQSTAKDKKRQILDIPCVEVNDSGRYEIDIDNRRRSAELTVEHYYTRSLQNDNCTEGDDVSLDCEVLYSDMVAQWYKDDIKIKNTSKLYITTDQKRHILRIPCVEVHDSGRYKIDIENRKRSADLRVESYFTKDFEQETNCLAVGEPVTFVCEVLDDNTAAKWFLNNKELASSPRVELQTTGRQHKLSINNVVVSDSGEYTINVNERKRKTKLEVKDYYTRSLQNVNCTEGEDVSLNCEVLYSDMEAQWYKDDIKISNTSKLYIATEQKRHILRIPCVEVHDSGRYKIDIENRKRSADLRVESYFTKDFEQETNCLAVGEPVTFVCKVLDDNTTAKWFLNDNELASSSRIELQTTGRQHKLSINNAVVSDSGEYAVNVNERKRKTKLEVKDFYTRSLQNVNCTEGEDVSLDCEVFYSDMEAQWYKDDIKINNTSKQYITREQKRHILRIPGVEVHDSGRYTIDIQNRKRSADLRVKSYFAKDFEQETNCLAVGEPVTFACEVLDDNTTAKWFLNDKELASSPRIELQTTGRQHKLSINNAVVSDSGEYTVIVKNSKRKTKLEVKDSEIIRHTYLKDIQTKTETRYYIRVMIVGKNGVGKSCLLRRLLDEEIEGVDSTDGIDISIHRCKFRLSDRKWIFNADQDPKREYAMRIKRARKEENVDFDDDKTISTNSQKNFLGKSDHERSDFMSQVQHAKHAESSMPLTTEDNPSGQSSEILESEQNPEYRHDNYRKEQQTPNERVKLKRKLPIVLTEKVAKEIDNFLLQIEEYEEENKVCVEIRFWDFAGEKDYYGTHHIFLDPNALYLLVSDCSEDIKEAEPCETYDSIGEYIDFWFDTIHNCADVKEETTTKQFDPSIIAVCTGRDKLTGKVKKKKDQYRQMLSDTIQDENKRNHLRDICFVSNTRPSDTDFSHLRNLIFEHGKKLQSFGEVLPLKWIRLEQSLDVLRQSGIHFVSRNDIIDLSVKCYFHSEEREKEVENFLNHQHKIGNIMYYSDIEDFVILSQQWLADAFKCLVSDKIDSNIKLSDEWRKLEKTGILEKSLISKLFENNPDLSDETIQENVITVLNKFGIIGINCEERQNLYYMPHMITTTYSPSLSVITERFGAVDEKQKSPWLCLEFDFFPLAYFTHVMLHFIGNYTMCFDKELKKKSIYHGVGVFIVDQKQVELNYKRLIVLFCKNTIAIQVWHYGDPVPKTRYNEILKEIVTVIHQLRKKYKARNLRYSVKLKWSMDDINSSHGRVSHEDLKDKTKDGKYSCDEHNIPTCHDSIQLFNTWFNEYPDKAADRCPEEFTAQVNKKLELWQEKDKMFVSTKAAKHVLECIKKNNCVTVTGNAGVGKTFLVRHVALIMKHEGYTVIPTCIPKDIIDLTKSGKKTLFVIDDIGGRFTLNRTYIDVWNLFLPHIELLLNLNYCKCIATCRLQVFKEEKFKDLSIFTWTECNLNSDKLRLTKDEKSSLLEKYFGDKSSQVSEMSDLYDWFSLICSLYGKDKFSDLSLFLPQPFDCYKQELDKLLKEGIEGRYKYCVLALVVMFNNKLSEDHLSHDYEKVIRIILDKCRLHRGTSMECLKDALNTLEGSFVVKDGDFYKTIHDKLFDFLTKYFGGKMLDCIIDYGTSEFINERILWKSPDNIETDIDFTIDLPDKYLNKYISRLVNDWSDGKVYSLFCSRNIKSPTFIVKLLDHIKQQDKSFQVKLANVTVDNDDHDTTLLQSCFIGDVNLTQWILDNTYYHDISSKELCNDSIVNKCMNDGASPVYIACQNGHVNILKILIENKADINKCNNNGASPVYIACQNGHVNILKTLIENKADINKRNNNGVSPLHIACYNNHINVVFVLLKLYKKEMIDLCDDWGDTPLHDTCSQGSIQVVTQLLQHGANPFKCNKDGKSPLQVADDKGNVDVVTAIKQFISNQ